MILTTVLLTASAIPGQPFWRVMIWLCLAGAAMNAGSPSFWVLPTMTLQSSAAAASIGMINSLANLSGFVAPAIVGLLLSRGFTNAQIVPVVACGPLVGAALVASLRMPPASPRRAEERES
jgi:ACS family tartrate transporter-like MFS transporter